MYKVLLYYKFTKLNDPHAFCAEHKAYCQSLGLLGRIYLSEEGINGTVAGETAHIDAYMNTLSNHPAFAGIEFKEDETDRIPFAKLIVKVRPEIVALKADIPLDPATEPGKHLSPADWRKVMETEKEYIMIDVRNNYESKIGHFEGAILPDLENFYDFPQWVDQQQFKKDQKILMYCTGGIRCEKFSILMEKKGYKEVYQLDGGIINYGKKEGGAHFKGKCFVFDDRLVVPVNPAEEEPISHCEITGVPCDTYINCANVDCNKLFICSEEGAHQMEGCCSDACKTHPRRRPFNAQEAYAPFRKWYHYFGPEFKHAKGAASQPA